MPHESNITYTVGNLLKTVFPENSIIFEGSVWSQRVDIVLSNYRLLVEVEPSRERVYAKGSGLDQLKGYAKKVIEIANIDWLLGVVAYEHQGGLKFLLRNYKRTEKGIEEKAEGELGLKEFENLLWHKRDILLEGKLLLNRELFVHVFKSVLEKYEKELIEKIKAKKDEEHFKSLYNAYANALKVIYGNGDELTEDKIDRLYSIHTILQAIAIGILSELYGNGNLSGIEFISTEGKPFAVGLPFLDWFSRIPLMQEEEEFFKKLGDYIKAQVNRFDYNQGQTVEIFRLLYEEFVDKEDRWTFGEYYTPLWLVNIALDLVGRDKIRNHIILDPFCGSGTFLYACFQEKVKSGKDPKQAISELVGFDINPLAVSLARAELLIAYMLEVKRSKQEPENVIPMVYYLNSAEVFSYKLRVLLYDTSKEWARNIPVSLYEVKELLDIVVMGRVASKLKELRKLQDLEYELKSLIMDIQNEGLNQEKTKVFEDKYGEVINFQNLERFISTYGNGVWSVAIVSLIARNVVFEELKGNIVIVSNPPWKVLEEVTGDYGETLRNHLSSEKLHIFGEKSLTDIIRKGDISSLFLYGFNRLEPVDIAFVMPETVAYDGKYSGVGKILTYNAMEGKVDVYRVPYNAFGHGVHPAIVKKGKDSIYEVNINFTPNKSLGEVPYEVKKINSSYKNYVEKVFSYFNIKLSKYLDVVEVFVGNKSITPLSGLFANENKLGLFICEIVRGTPEKFKLDGTNLYMDAKEVGVTLDKDIKYLVYYSLVFPFAVFPIKVLLSDTPDKLLTILNKIKEGLKNEILRKKVDNLIEEVAKIRNNPVRSNPNNWYVVYKDNGAFISGIYKGDFVMYQSSIFIECERKEQAYYYASLLNWLVIIVKDGYLRHNYGRPLKVVIDLGLKYEEEEWQKKVANLAEEIEVRAREYFREKYEKWKQAKCEGGYYTIRGKECINWLFFQKEWKEIAKKFNNKVDQKKLLDVIRYLRKE
ncbi:MAG: N-6 DNA methylase [Candidatus Aenigmatarchaeota archaeon]